MALIFRHIPRKGFLADPEQDFGILKNTDFSEQHLLELPDGKRAIVHFFTGTPDPKWPIQVMLKSEKFVRNATKHIILEKPQYYVPTINFFFRILDQYLSKSKIKSDLHIYYQGCLFIL